MRGYVLLILTITCLLVAPVGYSYACGSKHSPSNFDSEHTIPKKVCCNLSKQPGPGSKKKMCGHSCDGSGCSCAHGSSVFALKTQAVILIQKPTVTISQENCWFFKESTPQPVYLSLWMPPNISC